MRIPIEQLTLESSTQSPEAATSDTVPRTLTRDELVDRTRAGEDFKLDIHTHKNTWGTYWVGDPYRSHEDGVREYFAMDRALEDAYIAHIGSVTTEVDLDHDTTLWDVQEWSNLAWDEIRTDKPYPAKGLFLGKHTFIPHRKAALPLRAKWGPGGKLSEEEEWGSDGDQSSMDSDEDMESDDGDTVVMGPSPW